MGIEPTIFRLEAGRLIHLATEAYLFDAEISSTGFEPATPGILLSNVYLYALTTTIPCSTN